MRHFFYALLSLLIFSNVAAAQQQTPYFYEIGSPVLQDIWVDPAHGNDSASGATRSQALRSLTAAWNRIPASSTLTSRGFHILLTAGTFPRESIPNYWESHWGSQTAPIIVEGADAPGSTVFLGDVNMFDSRFVYFINLTIAPNPPGDTFHCERCDHVLLRRLVLYGGGARDAQETVKVNQSQYFYIEGSDISGAHDNNIDFVAVQYGHIVGNRIHNAEDWCVYNKGGSAYIRVEGNEIFDCGTGGYTAGQGTGFEYMSAPWLHYEAYDIKFINNIIHDTDGAGFGVNGGYNILLAHNTLYRVGRRSHGIEFVYGARSCDGLTGDCNARVSAGGWGTSNTTVTVPIPNRNVYVYNNVLYNPPGFQSQWQHIAVYGPQTPPAGSNVPNPARTDTNLRIGGNVLWNGPADLALGIDDGGCASTNPTCNETQLRRDNRFNTFTPDFVNAAALNFAPGAALAAFAGTAIPDFTGGDRVATPLAPQGTLSNQVAFDYTGQARSAASPRLGALLPGSVGVPTPPVTPPGTPGTPTTPPTEPTPPTVDLSPQLLGVRLGNILFASRGGRITVAAYALHASQNFLVTYAYSNGAVRTFRLAAGREDRNGVRTMSGSATLPASRTAAPQMYAVFLVMRNTYGDRTIPLANAVVLGRSGRR